MSSIVVDVTLPPLLYVDGVSRLFSYRRVADYPLLVFVGLDLDDALVPFQAHAMMIAGIAGLALAPIIPSVIAALWLES